MNWGLLLTKAMQAENDAPGRAVFGADDMQSVQTWSDRIIHEIETRTSALSAKVFLSNTWTEGEMRSFSPSIWSAYSLPSQGMAGRKIIGSDISIPVCWRENSLTGDKFEHLKWA
ncbi:hypothetical protein [Paraburkholderia sp. MM5384-R2]|uniref:hypothetical protein n=1 Tax=Paraburkholderia sp. MM5384-R2 TaxID=2723097 RepID=UPI00161BC36B|nr:hypothetical protein [Paraburkholderia sp. MM5384-R2]MBB5502018.1 hypothetical protein [Paraburkholderia sp. MM5384-R2]